MSMVAALRVGDQASDRARTDAFTLAEHAAFCDLLDCATGILTWQTPA